MSRFNVMIDIETLDTLPTAAIMQIGAVVDDTRYDIISKLQVNISKQSNINGERTQSADTLAWHQREHPALLVDFEGYITPLADGLKSLADFIPPKAKIWANSPSFDLVILRDAYRRADMPVPWEYWDERDYRTFYNEIGLGAAKMDKTSFEKGDHTAMEDASCQMRNLAMMVDWLDG